MKKKIYKYRKGMQFLLCFLLTITLIGCSSNQTTSMENTSKDAIVELDQKIANQATVEIAHKPNMVKVTSTFTKKVKTIYQAPSTPIINDGNKYCVLTFDDGPGVNSTQRILNVLAKYNIKGTWFVLGSRVHTYPNMVRAIASAGHEIGNHSYSHANLSTLSYQGYMNEINSTQNAIISVSGKTPTLLRPPYGSYTADIANNCGLGIALWNVDSLDWSHRYAPAIYNEVMAQMRTHSIILFHDIYDFTANAVEMIVPELVNQGYTFITFSQYLALGR